VSDIAVSVEGLGKRYRIAHQQDRYGRLTESLAGALRAPIDLVRGKPRETTEWIWALRNVSFELRQGDVVGVIGRNGAGKTTLLKVLSRITEPSAGSATLRGRVGSLLEVGTGFHPELTGRENVFMSGAVLGMGRAEIARKFDEIVEFAGIEQFLDTPVKRYSSGMQVRLGFAVAAHLETEILIVDEVLAVGDAEFQRKCLSKMGSVSREGRTVLFVSHNMAAVEALCLSGILLDRGGVVTAGTAGEVVADYLRRSEAGRPDALTDRSDRQGSGQLRVQAIEANLRTGSASELRLRYEAQSALRNVAVSLGLFTTRGEGVLFLANEVSGDVLEEIPAGGTLVCRFEVGSLLPGQYSLNVYCTVNGVVADWIVDAVTIDVSEGDFYGTGRLPPPGYGNVLVPYRWSVEA
jgi:lipopolysaccharide transport system ATP-binding protein